MQGRIALLCHLDKARRRLRRDAGEQACAYRWVWDRWPGYAHPVKYETHYLNTDLDLVAPCDLEPLVVALTAGGVPPLSVYQREDGCWAATLETEETFRQPEPNIAALLTAIESLGPEARAVWAACNTREFNLGYDCGDEPWAFTDQLTTETLARIASLGASLRLTLYPVRGPGSGKPAAPSPSLSLAP
jgi:hypothetical protein